MSEEIRQDQFEDKLIKANEILERLSDENISLEDSVKLHKEGKKLLDEAAKILQNAKLVINEIEDKKDE
ncbi:MULTISPECIES: exodeoxyribonuclease VII small subunit [unclassified Campylobacter]|uniref:exodeoxyribonuclease VII small subunit n=1 Tax=unclassified Campylobacter TaxID=2593542 RepID=UPI0014737AB7|nr:MULTISPECIES: exodeoxyribonuclease VII small subunit [unclassified Campylobacter]